MSKRKGFTLVELLVVLGIIALLISILMPALKKVQTQAMSVQCQSNLRQVGIFLIMYANENRGFMIPVGKDVPIPGSPGKTRPGHLGGGVEPPERWPNLIAKPPKPNPAILICPTDQELGDGDYMLATFHPGYPDPWLNKHSYVVNAHVIDKDVKFGKTKGMDATQIIILGEKKTEFADYHMDISDFGSQFDAIVEQYRHGLYIGSNYLYMDGHVASTLPKDAIKALDPWDPTPIAPPGPGGID
jgi:prepilin-type N-terminal cleavage/methylation domain-containing protein/prepilin-type processing-associated H-X9-DG protein